MKKFPSIKSNNDFQICYKNGKSYANRLLIMYVYANGKSENRIGISVSKKIGNSVVRHRVTRLIREIFRLNNERILKGYDLVVVVRKSADELNYKNIESAFFHLCKLHKII